MLPDYLPSTPSADLWEDSGVLCACKHFDGWSFWFKKKLSGDALDNQTQWVRLLLTNPEMSMSNECMALNTAATPDMLHNEMWGLTVFDFSTVPTVSFSAQC